MEDKVFNKLEQALSNVQKSVLLKDYTTYKIGGPAKYFFNARNREDLIKAVKTARELKLNTFILGGGSNILVSEKGFNGMVIKISNRELEMKDNLVQASAGVMLSTLVGFALENSLTGLEWASGIPGTVGGAVFGSAQAFGDKISDSVKAVEALDLKTLRIKKLSKKQCRFSLKNSIFKKDKNLIVISVLFKLKKGNKAKIKKKIIECLSYRKNSHPLGYPSAGSVFVNPENKDGIIYAGSLIEECGLKGKRIGRAEISKKHANFIINLGGAKASDVLALIKLAKKKVKRVFGISLEIEVQFVGINGKIK